MSLLARINSPQDLRRLSLAELNQLAGEIRQELVTTVSRTGGHLAPNLGVVELTLALHLVFNSPRDQIVWDVGHQTYVHKLVTGRRDAFATLRQHGGLSGFPKRSESVHDVFDTGHSSTSVSAALGLAVARDIKKESYHVVAVIGDGALTGGEAFEALNHAGHLGTRLIVVLNDNEMSIANNVGALSRYLSRLRTDPAYFRSKEEIEHLLRKIPRIGSRVLQAVDRMKDALKYLLVDGVFFEELGFTYLGPVNGHDLVDLQEVLRQASHVDKPVLVHVVTRKGKGYLPAEQNPDLFHGIGPFDIATGKPKKQSSIPTYTQVFGETLVKLAESNPRILAITAAMAGGTGLERFASRFPNRFFDVGIAEQHAVTLAAGMARGGLQPVVAIYSTFLQRAYDQVVHDVCLQNLPVVLAIDRAGLVGEDGATHQGIFDISFLRHIPNLVIIAPRDENELQHALYTALKLSCPVAVRYPRGEGRGVAREKEWRFLEPGRGEILREGQDVAIFGVGPMVYTALEAAELLREWEISAAVADLRYLKPLDEGMILQLGQATGRIVILEEHVLAGGTGSAVLEILHRAWPREKNMPAVLCLGLPDRFIEHGAPDKLREVYELTSEKVAESIMRHWSAELCQLREVKRSRFF